MNKFPLLTKTILDKCVLIHYIVLNGKVTRTSILTYINLILI